MNNTLILKIKNSMLFFTFWQIYRVDYRKDSISIKDTTAIYMFYSIIGQYLLVGQHLLVGHTLQAGRNMGIYASFKHDYNRNILSVYNKK